MKEKKTKKEIKEEPVEELPAQKVSEGNSVALSEYDHKRIDKDMKFHGPLSYRYLRLIAWISMSVMFICLFLGLCVNLKSVLGEVTPETEEAFATAANIMSFFAELPLPLFLIANMTIILQRKNNYKKLILTYGRILLAIYLGFLFVYYHYIVIALMRIGGVSFLQAREASIELFTELGKQSGLVVNVFVDLFCCVFIMFFIDYTPKKFFQGKKIILFRLLVLIPILYEIGSATMMGLLGMNAIFADFTFSLPPEILPLIGKKPLGMIIAFVFFCIYIKIREKRYLKKGGTPEGYQLYIRTNRNSFRFSVMMAVTFLIIGILDAAILIVAIAILTSTVGGGQEAFLEIAVNVLMNFTIGKSTCLILVIPIILLFSYTKTHANGQIDKIIPIIGIGLVIFSIIETLFFGLLF